MITKSTIQHCPKSDFCDIKASRRYDNVLDNPDNMLGSKWFRGARLNYAENLMRFRDDRTALLFNGEGRKEKRISYKDLYDAVARLSRSFREFGIVKGDRIAGFVPNMIEPVVAMLAAASMIASYRS